MTYSQKEKNKTWHSFDKELAQSIELGFGGHITTEFYAKLKSVKRVRLKLKIELILYITIFILSASKLIELANKRIPNVTPNMQLPIEQIAFASILLVMTLCIFKNLKIWLEINSIREQQFKDYHAKPNNRTR